MIVHIDNYIDYKSTVIGGKAKSLLNLTLNDFNVPNWCVIPEIYPKELLSKTNQDLNKLSAEDVKAKINSIEFDEKLITSIKDYFKANDEDYFSVRSSAADEDGALASFAGQYDTYLYVTLKEVAQKVKEVWLSAFSEHIQTYRTQNKLENNFFLSVIIQKMIRSDVSGIAFGANPINGNRKEKVISTVYGLGEGIVSGELNADSFIVLENQVKSKDIVIKERELIYKDNKLSYIEVEESRKNKQSLSEDQVLAVSLVLDKLKKIFTLYQDIEFAFENETLYLLQSRPITSLKGISDKSNNFQVWDNSNIVESYPGQSSPLTFAFVLKVYRAVYIQFCELMGVDESKVSENDVIFSNMLGLVHGKVYYNLFNWYKVLSLFPGYSVNKSFMEKMMGVKEPIKADVAIKNNDSRFFSKLKMFGSFYKIIKEFFKLKKDRARFLKYINEIINKYNKLDYDNRSAFDTMNDYVVYEDVLLKKWRAPLINDFFAMIFFGILQKQCEKYASDIFGLANDLLIGSNDIVSVEPIKQIQGILTEIRADESAYKLFNDNDVTFIYKNIKSTNRIVEEKIAQYLTRFGDRCTGELKLETKTYNTEPLEFIILLKGQLDVKLDIKDLTKNGKIKRKEAEEVIKKRLRGKLIKSRLFNFVLSRTRDLVSNRENLRFERTRAFGIVRKMFNGIGKQFFGEGIIKSSDDIFYLKHEEIFSYIRGTSVNTSLIDLIELRKKEYKQGTEQESDDRFDTYGITYVGNQYESSTPPAEGNSDLQGIGCSSGIVEQEVILVHSPKDIQNLEGKILVCESTDPGWVTLFPTCSAIVVERGSLLSHSAIVSREMGIPCIVSVSNLLKKLKTGDKIRMNGTTGEIEILNKIKDDE